MIGMMHEGVNSGDSFEKASMLRVIGIFPKKGVSNPQEMLMIGISYGKFASPGLRRTVESPEG